MDARSPATAVGLLLWRPVGQPAAARRWICRWRRKASSAENRTSRLRRSYYPNGLLASDSLWVRPYAAGAGGDAGDGGDGGGGYPDPKFAVLGTESQSVGTQSIAGPGPGLAYGIAYTYDGNGRRSTLTYPQALRPGAASSVSYAYADWGALESVSGLTGETYAFGYDAAGRLEALTYPSATGLTERYRYDRYGRRVRRRLGPASNPDSLYDDTLSYDARGKVVRAELRASQREVRTWYTGLGQVAAHRWEHTLDGDFKLDEFRSDPYGNVAWSRELDALQVVDPTYTHSYDAQGRLEERVFGGLESGVNVFRAYDRAGRVSYATEMPHVQNEGEVERRVSRHYYGADRKLVRIGRYARERVQGTV